MRPNPRLPLTLLAALFVAAGGVASAHPVTVENCGRALRFEAPPERAVAHDINMAEIMFALELQPRIVGLTGITGWYKTTPEFDAARGDIPELAARNPSLENILSADPDFLFAGWYYGMQPGGEVTPDTLAPFGVPVYVLSESCVHLDQGRPDVSMDTLYGDVRAIATIFGVEDRAEVLIAEWEARVEAARRETTSPLRVFLYDSGDEQPFTAGRFAMPTALIEAAGGRNVIDDVAMSWGRVGWETVGERDPEFIIVLDYGEDGGAGLIAFLEAHPVMSTVAAVRNGRFLPLKYSEITPGPANIGAIEKLAAALAAHGG
ncbi:ABC transporter substrate-binding protein [Rubrimonas sp.]|uniref:ABC transporter substrate-binding protein n=1 Tax=Rubrimonas sp. TaxID=2036015 RepID=UPI002FDCFE12